MGYFEEASNFFTPQNISGEMANKVICPQKNDLPGFSKSAAHYVILSLFLRAKHIISDFEGFFEGAKIILTPILS